MFPFDSYIFKIINNNPDASVKEIKEFEKVAEKLHIPNNDKNDAFSIYHIDTTANKVVFNNLVDMVFMCSVPILIIAKVIIDDELLLKAMEKDPVLIPKILLKISKQYKEIFKDSRNGVSWGRFQNICKERNMASIIKQISKHNCLIDSYSTSDVDSFYRELTILICNEELEDDKIALYIDTVLKEKK